MKRIFIGVFGLILSNSNAIICMQRSESNQSLPSTPPSTPKTPKIPQTPKRAVDDTQPLSPKEYVCLTAASRWNRSSRWDDADYPLPSPKELKQHSSGKITLRTSGHGSSTNMLASPSPTAELPPTIASAQSDAAIQPSEANNTQS